MVFNAYCISNMFGVNCKNFSNIQINNASVLGKEFAALGNNLLMLVKINSKEHLRNPNRGVPGTTSRIFYPDGSPKQEREYGADGKPIVDHDHHNGHPEVGYDHDHEWDWTKKNPRQGPKKPNNNVLGWIGLVGSVFALGWVVINDITGAGVADDALVHVLITSIVVSAECLFDEDGE